jgi:hypothetical protein
LQHKPKKSKKRETKRKEAKETLPERQKNEREMIYVRHDERRTNVKRRRRKRRVEETTIGSIKSFFCFNLFLFLLSHHEIFYVFAISKKSDNERASLTLLRTFVC